jgi:hypothetical protein
MDTVMDEDGTIEDDAAAQYARLFDEMGIAPPPALAAQLGAVAQPGFA